MRLFKRNWVFIIFIIISMIGCTTPPKKGNAGGEESAKQFNLLEGKVEHGYVFYEEGKFAGWPANHGLWQWKDGEILMGFNVGDYRYTGKFHDYDSETAMTIYARSFDGGSTWTYENALENGQTGRGKDHKVPLEIAEEPKKLEEKMPDFTSPDFILTFLREGDNKGDTHFYYSENRGKKWNGPYEFPDLGNPGVLARTDYIVEGENELGAFITMTKESDMDEGHVAYVKTNDGGLTWELVSFIGEVPEPRAFDIMPSTLRLSPDKFLTVLRTHDVNRKTWVSAYKSEDNGETWIQLNNPTGDTGQYGNPGTLVKMKDGRIALSYVFRSDYGSRLLLKFSEDEGETWSDEITLRCCDGANHDVGYPKMLQRDDGKLMVFYYWNESLNKNKEPFRYIAYTLVDPSDL